MHETAITRDGAEREQAVNERWGTGREPSSHTTCPAPPYSGPPSMV